MVIDVVTTSNLILTEALKPKPTLKPKYSVIFYLFLDIFTNLASKSIGSNSFLVWADGTPFDEAAIEVEPGFSLNVGEQTFGIPYYWLGSILKTSNINDPHYFICQRNYAKPSI